MGLMWFCLGLLVGLSVFVAKELHERFEMNWQGWAGLAMFWLRGFIWRFNMSAGRIN